MCRLDSICHSNLVSIAHSKWYMFEFDCAVMLSNSNSIQDYLSGLSRSKSEDVSILKKNLESFFWLSFLSNKVWGLNTRCVHKTSPISQKFSATFNMNQNETINFRIKKKAKNICEKIWYTIALFDQFFIFWFLFWKFLANNCLKIIIVRFKFRERWWIFLTCL
jgi:hypothetical protein